MLIMKRNFILHVLNVVKCTLRSGTGTQSYKGGWVKKGQFMWCSLFGRCIWCWQQQVTLGVLQRRPLYLKSHSRISYGSLFARASNFSTLHLIPIHPLPRERKLKRNHVAAKLANHLSDMETWPLAWGHVRIIDFKVPGGVNMVCVIGRKLWLVMPVAKHTMINWSPRHQCIRCERADQTIIEKIFGAFILRLFVLRKVRAERRKAIPIIPWHQKRLYNRDLGFENEIGGLYLSFYMTRPNFWQREVLDFLFVAYCLLSRLHTSKFSLTSFDLANFICWCVKKNLSFFSLASALVQKLAW